jgi:hypothetical protein
MIKVLSNHKKQLDSYRGNVRNHVSVHDGVVILIFANRRRGWQFSFFIGGEIRRQPLHGEGVKATRGYGAALTGCIGCLGLGNRHTIKEKLSPLDFFLWQGWPALHHVARGSCPTHRAYPVGRGWPGASDMKLGHAGRETRLGYAAGRQFFV